MFTSNSLESEIKKLIKTYPFINISTIGTSRLSKPIFALTLGHGSREIFINAAHHANEWITSVILMRFLEEISGTSPTLWDEITLHCVPMVNPDGVDLLTGGIEPQRAACKQAQEIADSFSMPFPTSWKANICGVDLNSNYPAGWDIAREFKFAKGFNRPAPRDYVGENPLSEPESSAIAAYTLINDFALTISLHTQGEEIYWRYMDYNPPGAAELAEIFSSVSGYACEDVPDESSHAGYRDWFIATFNRPGFTIECGFGENPLPLSQLDEIYKKTSPILREALFFRP